MKKNFDALPENESRDFNGKKLSVGDMVVWKDEATKRAFTTPALGYGEGPIEILGFSTREGRYGQCVNIRNAKGQMREVSSDLFIKTSSA